MDNFLRFLTIDEQTGALYLNITEQSGIYLYTKWSKLRKYFYFDRNITSKLIKIDIQNDINKFNVYIELVFAKQNNDLLMPTETFSVENLETHRNKFKINSNNLLNLFPYGDEFLLTVSVDENSLTWLDSIVSLRDYLRTSVLRSRKSALQFEMIKDSLKFYLLTPDDSYFR